MIKANDIVRIHAFAGTPDEMAMVDKVDRKKCMVWVTNLNMPFCGTLCNYKLGFSEVELV